MERFPFNFSPPIYYGIARLISVNILLFSALAWSTSAIAFDTKRPKIGLVLSGGGALGFAHIGVLKVLEQSRVPVDCVVGTSMGALIGGIYASGLGPDEIEAQIAQANVETLFDDEPPRSEISQRLKRDEYTPLFDFNLGFNNGEIQLPSGASAGYKFELLLNKLVGVNASLSDINFNALPIPYRAVATDLESGQMKVFEQGNLPKVMRASMSLPAVISPIEIDGRLYVDGGLTNNLPVEINRQLCGDIVIAVNLGTKPKPMDQINTSIDVAIQTIVILTEQNVKNSLNSLQKGDILIVPDLTKFDSSNFSGIHEIVQQGIDAAKAISDKLQPLSVSESEFQSWLNIHRRKPDLPFTISKINVTTDPQINPDAVLRDIDSEPGDTLDTGKLHRSLVDLFGRGDFAYVGYTIEPDENDVTLIIDAQSKPWGPGYLKTGFGAATDFKSPSQLNLAASYRRTWVNTMGAELRTDAQIGDNTLLRTEFMQPLQIRDGAFISPIVGVRRYFEHIYTDDIRLGAAEIKLAHAELDIGITGSMGEIRIGPYFTRYVAEPDFSVLTPLIPKEHSSQKGLLLWMIYDSLNSFTFPRAGLFTSINLRSVSESGDSDGDYFRAEFMTKAALSAGKNSLLLHAEWGDFINISDNLPSLSPFKLGGPGRLSGLYLNQRTGTRFDLETLTYYREYTSLPSQLGKGMYFGASLETGEINDALSADPSDRIHSASVFWATNTILGTLYIGYGISSLDQRTWYLTIGPQF